MMRRTAHLALAFAALTATAAHGADPRSAIPWLSRSIEETPEPPRASALQTRPAEDADAITVTTLSEVSRNAAGLLPPDLTGFPRALWGAASAFHVRGVIAGHPAGGVPEARALFRRVLMAEADPPRTSGDRSTVLVARLDRLLEMGALEEAWTLIEQVGPGSPALFRRWFDAGLLLNRADPPCEALRRNPQLSPTLPARVFCLARGGDWNAAEITLSLGQDLGSIPPGQQALLERFLDPELFEEEPHPPLPEVLTPLDFLMREAVGLPRPPGTMPLAFLARDLDAHAPMRQRIVSGERLVEAGSAAPTRLFAAYRAGEPAASGGVWDRARAVQALNAALIGDARQAFAAALVDADTAFTERGLRVAFAQEYAPRLAARAEADFEPETRRRLVELLLLGDEPAAARRAAGPSPSPEIAALLALAGVRPAPGVVEDARLRAALAALEPDAAGAPAQGPREDMLARGRVGEAILAALAQIQSGAASDPRSLQTALATLRRAGQEKSARKIALQTLLAQPEA